MQHSSRTKRRARQYERSIVSNNEAQMEVEIPFVDVEMNYEEVVDANDTIDYPLPGQNILLCEQSSTTHLDGILLLLKYIIQFKIGGDQLDTLLAMLDYLFPNTTLPNNKNEFFKNWLYLKDSFVYYDYCDACSHLFDDQEICCPICNDSRYLTTATGGRQFRNCFIYFPLASLLKERLKDETFVKKLVDNFEVTKNPKPKIEDISDGAVWQRLRKEHGLFRSAFDLALGINIDGGVAFAATGIQLWPIFLAINNLPADERFKEENMLMNCLWIGSGTPNMEVYLLPFVRDLQQVYHKPVQINSLSVRAILLYLTADLKAKAPAMGFESCTSTYGCTVCEIRGYHVDGSMRFVTATEELALMRDHISTRRRAVEAVQSGTASMGVAGLSPLYLLPYFDIISQCVVDPMHCICLNVSSLLWTLWISDKYTDSPFSIRRHVDAVNAIQQRIQIPYGRESRPRQVDDFGSWKAHEHKFWLLYLAVPILQQFLPRQYWDHLCDLCEALHILWAPSISEESILKVEDLLFRFVNNFSSLYPIATSTINVHYLLHLAGQAVNFGPLWTHAAFPFEHKMGAIIDHVHGNNTKQAEQLLFMAVLINSQQIISDHFVNNDKKHNVFRKLKLTQSSLNATWSAKLPSGIDVIDKLKKYHCCPSEIASLSEILLGACDDWWRFFKLRKGRQLYCASKYTFSDHQTAKRCSHYAICRKANGEEEIRRIDFFLIRTMGSEAIIVASTKECQTEPIFTNTVKLVRRFDTERFILIDQIVALCVVVQIGQETLFTRLVHCRD